MWVSRIVAVTSVLMVFISNSASKPQQGVTGIPKDDNDFLNALSGPGAVQPVQGCPSPSESCVLIDKCCDPKPTEHPSNEGDLVIDPISGAPQIFDLDFVNPKIDVNTNPCSLLQICCEKKCDAPPPPPPTPTPPKTTEGPPVARCGIRNAEGFRVTITGDVGRATQYGEYPWMVAVLTQGNSEYIGGGSLIHQNIVLTAAHKVHGKDGLVARIGDWDLSDKIDEELVAAQTINVKKIIYHPQFARQTLVNNVALLILESDAELGGTVMPICLPDPNDNFDGASCTVTGWGKSNLETGSSFQKVLKKITVPAVSNNECQRLLKNTRLGQDFTLHESFNCAGGEGEDSCEGDGGSPLICPKPNNPSEYVQMGVVAWGIGCGVKGNPGVYGSVPNTVEWIKQIIKEEGGINPRVGSPRG